MNESVIPDEAAIPPDAVPAKADGRTESDVRAMVRTMVIELSPERDESSGPDTLLIDQLAYNSLALVELAFTLEDEFDLSPIDEATARQISTLGKVQDHVVGELVTRGDIAPGT